MAYFPLIGLLLGGFLAGLNWAGQGLLPPSVLGVLEAGWLVLLTRALHLDGLADTVDGLGGGRDAEHALFIMKDSNVGAFGVTAVVLVLLLKASCLAGLSRAGAWQVMLIAPCLSRFSLTVLGCFSCYARPGGGLGTCFVGRENRWTLFLSAPTALVAGWIMLGCWGIGAVGVVAFLGLLSALFFRKVLGGVTGDVLGAHLEITESLVLLAGLWLVGRGGAW